jgi:hypothetical protein
VGFGCSQGREGEIMNQQIKPGDCFGHLTAVAPVDEAPGTWTSP